MAPAAPAKAQAAQQDSRKVDPDKYDARNVPSDLRASKLTIANQGILVPLLISEFKKYMTKYGESVQGDWDQEIRKEITVLLTDTRCRFKIPAGVKIISPEHNLENVKDVMLIMSQMPNSRIDSGHYRKYNNASASTQQAPRKKLCLFFMQVGVQLYTVKRGRDSWKTVAGLTLEDCDDMLSSKGKYHDLQ